MLPNETKYSIRGIMKVNQKEIDKLARKIIHLTGECGCSSNSKTCAYWKNVDKADYNWQTNLIIKEVKKLIKEVKC